MASFLKCRYWRRPLQFKKPYQIKRHTNILDEIFLFSDGFQPLVKWIFVFRIIGPNQKIFFDQKLRNEEWLRKKILRLWTVPNILVTSKVIFQKIRPSSGSKNNWTIKLCCRISTTLLQFWPIQIRTTRTSSSVWMCTAWMALRIIFYFVLLIDYIV